MKLYTGIVESNADPLQCGRVQVRIKELHSDVKSGFGAVKTSDLPWSEVLGSNDFGLVNGIGCSSILRVGTQVWLVLDHDDPNFPIVIGVRKGAGDINSGAKRSYTNIAFFETASGHKLELSDAGGSAIIKVTHNTGSYIEIANDGTMNVNSVKDLNFNVAKNLNITTGENTTISTTGNTVLSSNGSTAISADGTSTMTSVGNFKINAARIDLN